MGLFSSRDPDLKKVRVEILSVIDIAQREIKGLEESKKKPEGADPGDVRVRVDAEIKTRKEKLLVDITATAKRVLDPKSVSV